MDLKTPLRAISSPAALPTSVNLIAYFATTVIAATSYMLGFGGLTSRVRDQITIAAIDDVGSPIYVALLYLPLIIIPLTAWLTVKVLRPRITALKLPTRILEPRISRAALWFLTLVSVAYCMLRLHQFGALSFEVLGDADYKTKTIQRMMLLDHLGYVFFAFAYGINLMLPILAFLAFDKQGNRLSDLILFLISFCFFVVIVTLTFSKAQIVVYAILMICAFALTRSRPIYVVSISAISAIAFLIIGYAINAPPPSIVKTQQVSAPEIPQPSIASHIDELPHLTEAIPHETTTVAIPTPPPSHIVRLEAYIGILAGSVLNRMGLAHPYYVAMFADADQRCGIQGVTLRAVLHLPESKCILPTKIFRAIYPYIDFVQGQQPAPASLSAYGELGFLWSVSVMVISGLSLGILGSISSLGRGPIFIGFTVASCAFGYYLSQVPIVASFLYPHGLIPFLMPVVFIFGIAVYKRSEDPLSVRSVQP